MRIHRVRLRNYRGINDCAITFSLEGVTVVEGPNEVGKTSIPDAIDLILELVDSSSSRRVKLVQPVGRDVGPEVEVEISSGAYRFVYHKRWLRERSTTLEVTAPQREQRTGREAHDRVTEILSDTLDRQLWNALRIAQGTGLTLPSFDAPSLGRALDQAADVQLASERDDNLWERVCEEYSRYWTDTGKPKGDRKSSSSGVAEALSRVMEIENDLRGIEDDADKVNQLAEDQARLAKTREEYENRENDLAEQWAETKRLYSEVKRLRLAHEATIVRRDRCADNHQRRLDVEKTVNERSRELSALETEADREESSLSGARQRTDDAKAGLAESRDALRAAESEQRRERDDYDHARRKIEVEQLRERHDEVVQAEAALRAADTQLDAAKVDDDLLAQIEQAHLNKVAADAAVASIETTALTNVSLRIGEEDVALAADESRRTVVEDEVELLVADLARIRVTAGTGSKNLAVERSNARDTLTGLCEIGGVADLAAAQRVAEQRRAAERDREAALATKSRALRDLTFEDIGRKIRGLTRRIDAYAGERPSEPPMPADPSSEVSRERAERADRLVARLRDEFDHCQQAHQDAYEKWENARRQHIATRTKVDIARDALRMAKSSLDDARREQPDSEIAGQLAAAQHDAEAGLMALEEAEADLEATDPSSVEIELQNAREAAVRAANDLKSTKALQNDLRIGLEIKGERGLHTRLDEARSEHEHLAREHDRTEARAEAARLLYDTFEQQRQEARQRYVGPFRQRIEQLGRVVFNRTFEIDLDDELRITRRTLDGDTLLVNQLSTGAQEQLGVIGRLACAAIVSPDGGGAPVIIDDALGWSDPERLRSMGAAIAAAGGQCQVIILTCTPGRYAHIGNATTVRLPAGS